MQQATMQHIASLSMHRQAFHSQARTIPCCLPLGAPKAAKRCLQLLFTLHPAP